MTFPSISLRTDPDIEAEQHVLTIRATDMHIYGPQGGTETIKVKIPLTVEYMPPSSKFEEWVGEVLAIALEAWKVYRLQPDEVDGRPAPEKMLTFTTQVTRQ